MTLLQHVTQMLEHATDKYSNPLWKSGLTVVRSYEQRSAIPVLEADAYRLTQALRCFF